MVTFNLQKRTPSQTYRKFKYRDLLTRYLDGHFEHQKELTKIERFTRYGESLYQEGDTDGALDALLMAKDAAPNNARPYNNLGVFHRLEGNLEKAVEHFATARRLNPFHRDTIWNCGQIMADSKEYMMARNIYHQYMANVGYDEEMVNELKGLQTSY